MLCWDRFGNFCRRRFESFAFFVHLFVTQCYTLIIILPLLYFVWFRFLAVAYGIYRYLHKDCEFYGGLRTNFSSSYFYKSIGRYMNLKIVPLAEYPEGRNYIIAAFPHGTGAFTHISAVANKSLEGAEVFTGRLVHFAVSSNIFSVPLSRDLHLGADCIDASERSIKYLLQGTGRGRFVYVLPGGSREAFVPTDSVVLSNRRGFCRIALQTGSWLIPAYSFGETSLYENEQFDETDVRYKFQQKLLEKDGTVWRLIKGQKWYNLWLTLPKRVSANIVMGEPIPVQKVPKPSKQQIYELHQLFTCRLFQLFETHKYTYLENAYARQLNIV